MAELVASSAARESADALLAALHACIEDARAVTPATLTVLRLGMRCVGPLLRVTRTLPDHRAATIIALRQLSTLAEIAARDANDKHALGYRSVHISCEIHLARLATEQIRAEELANLNAPQPNTLPIITQLTEPTTSDAIPSPQLAESTTSDAIPTTIPSPQLAEPTTSDATHDAAISQKIPIISAPVMRYFYQPATSHAFIPRPEAFAPQQPIDSDDVLPALTTLVLAAPEVSPPTSQIAASGTTATPAMPTMLPPALVPMDDQLRQARITLSEQQETAFKHLFGIALVQSVPQTIGPAPRLSSKRKLASFLQKNEPP